MKKTILILAVLLAACATGGKSEKSATVWEPAKTLPTYRVRQEHGQTYIYKYGDPFQYKYRIDRLGNVYKYGDPERLTTHLLLL